MPQEKFTFFENLPDLIIRCQVAKLTDNLVSPRTLANHDSLGTGPHERVKINGKIAYPKAAFLAWLCDRSQNCTAQKRVRAKYVHSILELNSYAHEEASK